MSARDSARVLSLLVASTIAFSVAPAVAVEPTGLHAATDSNSVGGRGAWHFNSAEQCLMNKINRARSKNGRSRLVWDKQIGVVARRHAKSMAASYSVYHDYNMDDEITRWKALGQNSGAGNGCRKLFWAFMRSSGHRANILGRWRFIGVGIDKRGGRLFAQQVFEWRADPGNVYRYP